MPKIIIQSVIVFAATLGSTTALHAQNSTPGKPVKQLILPGESFLVDDRPAFILWPDASKRQQPQPWVWYAPTLRGLPDKHEKWMHEQFLAAGIAVAGIDIGESFGSPQGQSQFTSLYNELTQNRGFAPKPCMLGRSRGGLMVSSWAIANPDKIAGLAGIYPVFDLRAYPSVKRAAPAYGLTSEQLTSQLDTLNPIARVHVLATSAIPVCLIHGNVDTVVPLESNSQALVDAYEQSGVKPLATLVVPDGQGHNFWPGFFRCEELIQFVIERSQAGAS